VEPELDGFGTATAGLRRVGYGKNRCILADRGSSLFPVEAMAESAWNLARELVEEGLRDDAIPSLARLGELGQLGDLPALVAELARQLEEPNRLGEPDRRELTARVRAHAHEREAIGFAPGEIVAELLLLRRVLARFASGRAVGADDVVDRLVTECVVAYFDRVTADLALRARRDPLTELLNHQAFADELELEFERSRRYGHGLTLVFFDVDEFKQVNDTYGHPEGDRVLRLVAHLVRARLRCSDLAGRMGGDEFAVALVESDTEAGGHFLARIVDAIDECVARGELPAGFSISPGLAHYPTDADSAATLYKLADVRLYEAKRAKQPG
jgi:diguanylate cyclase (GGDEF)-like protein